MSDINWAKNPRRKKYVMRSPIKQKELQGGLDIFLNPQSADRSKPKSNSDISSGS